MSSPSDYRRGCMARVDWVERRSYPGACGSWSSWQRPPACHGPSQPIARPAVHA